MIAEVDNHELEFQNVEELLGIDIDSTLISEYHISKICTRAIQKLIVEKPIVKKKLIVKNFDSGRRVLNSKINCFHERALRITYGDKISSF